ncbi:hypothetical protein H696_01015, partial [Fonticula alba]
AWGNGTCAGEAPSFDVVTPEYWLTAPLSRESECAEYMFLPGSPRREASSRPNDSQTAGRHIPHVPGRVGYRCRCEHARLRGGLHDREIVTWKGAWVPGIRTKRRVLGDPEDKGEGTLSCTVAGKPPA